MKLLSKPRFEYAKRVGRDFVKSLGLSSYPIDPIDIIYRMKWQYEIDDLHGEEGYTFYNPSNDQYMIVIDNSQQVSKQRCKFTIAHEIGHILLCHYTTFDMHAMDDEAIGVLDVEANIVAGEILMPYLSIRKNEGRSISYLAHKYDVTNSAMETRLRFLGLSRIHDIACESPRPYDA